ncbi:hypothetical protein BJF88_11530 [Cellulosimicrobium sp. CUA-896]|nr:hypothetical protein BJF88_11530 [Cellulosimicrobium sp. CUA-896]
MVPGPSPCPGASSAAHQLLEAVEQRDLTRDDEPAGAREREPPRAVELGDSCILPDRGGHSATNVLLAMLLTSRSA